MLHTAATLRKHKQQCDRERHASGGVRERLCNGGSGKGDSGSQDRGGECFVCLGGEKGIRVSSAV